MAESFVQVAPDSTGKKLRANSKVVGADTVYEQYVMLAGLPTYYYQSAQNSATGTVTLMDLFNAAGSGVIVKIRKLFLQQAFVAQVGIATSFDIAKTSSVGTGGTAITGRSVDSADPAIPAQVTARSIPTGGAASVFSWMNPLGMSGEETDIGGRGAMFFNVMAEGNETKDVVLREGEGIKVVKTTTAATTGGNWSGLLVATVE